MKLSIAGKGIILVTVPLIFEIAFVYTLVNALNQAEAQTDRQLRSQEIVEKSTILLRQIVSMGLYTIVFQSDRQARLSNGEQSITGTFKQLDELVKDDRVLRPTYKEVKRSSRKMYEMFEQFSAQDVGRLMSDMSNTSLFIDVDANLRQINASVRTFSAVAASDEFIHPDGRPSFLAENLKWVLLTGVLSNLAITIALALNFTKSISSKLSKLAENTRLVSRGLDPLPLLGGGDELSQLDLVIHRLSEQLKAADKQRQLLASMLKERLQQPLVHSVASLRLLQESASGELNKNGNEWLKTGAKNIERLIGLLDDLLQLENVDRGFVELEVRALNSEELIKNSLDAVQSLLDKKHINVQCSDALIQFAGDKNRLTQVLVNFLSNAIKFSPANSTLTISCQMRNAQLEVRVKDEGPGVPKELQGKIFERYEQTERKDATTHGGAGLGLNICAIIVRSHGGTIGVDSEPGQGSEFWFAIPPQANTQLSMEMDSSGTAVRLANADLLPEEAGASVKAQKQEGANSLPADGADTGAALERGDSLPVEAAAPRSALEGSSIDSVAVKDAELDMAGFDSVLRLKIWHKGLIVVAVPLIFQVLFVFVLSTMLLRAETQTNRVLHAMRVTQEANSLFRECVTLGTTSGGVFLREEDEKDFYSYAITVRAMLDQCVELFRLNHNDRRALSRVSAMYHKTEAVVLHTGKLMLNNGGNMSVSELANFKKRVASIESSLDAVAQSIGKVLEKQKEIEDKSPALRKRSREDIQLLIIEAVVLSVLLSILLGAFFSTSISKRLKVLIDDTLRFTEGKPLLPILQGHDELQLFHSNFKNMVSRLEENQEFKQHMLAVVSHELRTPLTSVFGFLTMLQQGVYGRLTQSNLSEVEATYDNVLQVILLVNDLLDLERIEAGKFPLELQDVDPAYALEAALASAKETNPDVDFPIANKSKAAPAIIADPVLCTKAFSRLLLFCHQSGGKTSEPIYIIESAKTLTIRVPYAGTQLDKTDPALLFNKFQFLADAIGEKQDLRGSSLSLALCKTIIQLLKGDIHFEFDDRHRAFVIELPLIIDDDAVVHAEQSSVIPASE